MSNFKTDLSGTLTKPGLISLFQPTLGQEELDNIKHTFERSWPGKGMKVEAFEYAWADHIGASPEQVVSVSSATEGLFQVCQLLLDWRDEVIIPSIHFVGAANAVAHRGGYPVYCDVDRHTLNPTLEHIQRTESFLGRGQAVILLHYGGVAQELDTIREWCDDKGLLLIEDAACAPDTTYKGKAAGTWGHFGIWSFDAMKILSTGDGGMIYCEDPAHAKELRKRLYLGMNNESGLKASNERWWEFEVSYPGRRAVMNDLAAGVGLEQLKKLDDFVYRRATLYDYYDMGLADNPIDLPPKYYCKSSYYFYWIQTSRRDELAKFLRANDIYTSFRYWPLHRVFKTGQSLPGAEYAADNTLLLPLHCGLTDDEVSYVCEKVREFYG